MRVRLAPLGLAVLAVMLAWGLYLRPTGAGLAALRTRVQRATNEVGTIGATRAIEARVDRERAAIAAHLRDVPRLGAAESQARMLRDLGELARRDHVAIVALSAKGNPAPLATASAFPPSATPVAAADDVRVTRSPRSMTLEGSFADVLRFVDGLGAVPELIAVRAVALTQGERLSATVDFDLLVLDPSDVPGGPPA